MYVAKRSGGGYALYQPEQEAQTLRRSGLAGELRRSIPQGELLLHYQPQVTLATGAIQTGRGAGAVEPPARGDDAARQVHPDGGGDRHHPSPDRMGDRLPRLTQLCTWLADGIDVAVSLNVSPRNIEDHSLEEMVARALGNFKVDPSRLTLEITEGVAMAAAAAKALHRLHRDRRSAGARRLRHRLLVAALPHATAGQRDQDRPLVRVGLGFRHGLRRHRSVGCRASATTSACAWWPKGCKTGSRRRSSSRPDATQRKDFSSAALQRKAKSQHC